MECTPEIVISQMGLLRVLVRVVTGMYTACTEGRSTTQPCN